MADTGAPFEIPYVEPTDLVRTYPAASELLADAIADQFGLGYQYVGTRYYTSSGTFAKADPFGDSSFDGAKMRALRVRMVGGGGGSGGTGTTAAGQIAAGGGGGGGGYAEKFITDIASLSASETITRGDGGAGGATGSNAGSAGGQSSAFTVTANGGEGGAAGPSVAFASFSIAVAAVGTAASGDLNVTGETAIHPFGFGSERPGQGRGGSSALGQPSSARVSINTSGDSPPAVGFGAGATGATARASTATTNAGAAGGAGIVIIDVFA